MCGGVALEQLVQGLLLALQRTGLGVVKAQVALLEIFAQQSGLLLAQF